MRGFRWSFQDDEPLDLNLVFAAGWMFVLHAVDGGERAVLFDRFRGVLDDTAGEGTHFLIPGLQRPYIFDIRTRPRHITTVTGTKGLNASLGRVSSLLGIVELRSRSLASSHFLVIYFTSALRAVVMTTLMSLAKVCRQSVPSEKVGTVEFRTIDNVQITQ